MIVTIYDPQQLAQTGLLKQGTIIGFERSFLLMQSPVNHDIKR